MIYLIDDKNDRRKEYGWSDNKLQTYSEVIMLVSSRQDYDNFITLDVTEKDVILYHVSFALSIGVDTKTMDSTIENLSHKHKIAVAYFSGSNSSRKYDERDNSCVLPVADLYRNLQCFVEQYKNKKIDMLSLVYGNAVDREKEEELRTKLDRVSITPRDSQLKSFFFKNSDYDKPTPFSNCEEIGDWWEEDCSDTNFINAISQHLSSTKYDIIFVPLCLGETLTDYLGLRLAMLVRLCDTVNRLTDICIYGESNIADFCTNECFDILKMSGVKYCSFKFENIYGDKEHLTNISEANYEFGLKRIKLEVPSDIGDNHSVSNLWSIYRWATTIEEKDDDNSDINKVKGKISKNLYFKYLQALYPVTQDCKLSKNQLKIEEAKDCPKLNVLLIDDEADKGWYEIFCRILCDDVNDIKFNYLGDDIKGLSQDEIISKSLTAVKEYNSNLVILDYRLTLSDFGANKVVSSITGYKLLKRIKEYNRGIQVIVFSATNKVWNWQALQSIGADGFIMKESPANSVDVTFTSQTIRQFIDTLTACSEHTYKMNIWRRIQELKDKVSKIDDPKKVTLKGTLGQLLLMTEDILFVKNSEYPLPHIFINAFRIVEVICSDMIDDDRKKDPHSNHLYYRVFKDNAKPLKNYTKDAFPNKRYPYITSDEVTNINKICNGLAHVGAYNINLSASIKNCVDKRNSFTHPNKGLPRISVLDVNSIFDIVYKLIMGR